MDECVWVQVVVGMSCKEEESENGHLHSETDITPKEALCSPVQPPFLFSSLAFPNPFSAQVPHPITSYLQMKMRVSRKRSFS